MKILDRGRLELAVDERVEILADWLIVVRADDHVRAAGAGLQARIERLSARAVRARREKRRAAADGGARQHVLAGRQLDAEPHAKIVGRQKAPGDPPSCLHDDFCHSASMREAS